MDGKFRKILCELKSFCESLFGKEYFTIVYGSYVYGVATSNSDLDFVTVSRHFDGATLRKSVKFALSLYHKYNLAFDNEVPHEKKILVSYETLNNAIIGKGFQRKRLRIYVPPIIKTAEFLCSDKIAMRLLLNAITGKNFFVSGDRKYFYQKKEEAIENMIGFLFSIDAVNSFTISDFVLSLIGTPERSGEMYLGYKNKLVVREYLTETFKAKFEKLVIKKILQKSNGRYYLFDHEWLNRIIC